MTIRYRVGHRIVDGRQDDDPLRFVIATEGRKADGIDLRMDRLDLTRYSDNPVVFNMHDWRQVVGRGENVEVDSDRLLADAIFDTSDELGAEIDRKYRDGFLHAVSVGFDLHGVDDETGVPNRWELLEFSSVTMPLDPEALVESGRMARAFALTEALREGKVLSKGNQKLVEEAITALQSLLEAAQKADKDDDPDDEPRGGEDATPRLDVRRRRLQLLGA